MVSDCVPVVRIYGEDRVKDVIGGTTAFEEDAFVGNGGRLLRWFAGVGDGGEVEVVKR